MNNNYANLHVSVYFVAFVNFSLSHYLNES